MPAAETGLASQKSVKITDEVESKLQRSLMNMTLTHSYLQGWWTQAVAATSPVWLEYILSFQRGQEGLDSGDFGNLAEHTGDIVLYDCRKLLESEATDDVLFPRTDLAGSGIRLESRGMRKIERVGDTLFFVTQKSATEQDIIFEGSLTLAWLLPA